MASTVKAKTLRVTIQEELVLNGVNYGSKTKFNYTSINEIYRRVVSCAASSSTTIAVFKSAVTIEDSVLDIQDVKYIRVTNLDDTTDILLNFQLDTAEDDSAAADNTTIVLGEGESFIYGSPHDSIGVDSTSATIVTTLVDIESIVAKNLGSDIIDIEIFIASA
tara:strand:+ start:535 stop:1026 length:492 start_codon:yes stop_codon:yes gene_type:complete